ncbi:MAG: hypothetical protein ACRDP5_10790 [Streptosporangiaceae bacterium]
MTDAGRSAAASGIDPRAQDFFGLPGQLARLAAFRAARPHVLIGGGEFGTWQALIPEENGETFIVRYALRELLDKLDEIYPPGAEPG